MDLTKPDSQSGFCAMDLTKPDCPHSKPEDPLHSCPYEEDVGNNSDPEYCNCCDSCMEQCASDI